MKEFTHNNRTFLAIEVSEGATNFKVYQPSFYLEYNYGGRSDNDTIHIEDVETPTFNIISLLKDATEEQCKEMVFKQSDKPVLYANYASHDGLFSTAIQSLTSRLISLGMDTNKNILLIEKI